MFTADYYPFFKGCYERHDNLLWLLIENGFPLNNTLYTQRNINVWAISDIPRRKYRMILFIVTLTCYCILLYAEARAPGFKIKVTQKGLNYGKR